MKLITVNFHLNQTYNVEDSAINDVVISAFKDIKSARLVGYKVKIDKNHENFKLTINVDKDKEVPFKKATSEIKSILEEYLVNLLDSKGENIQIIFGDVHDKK